jgi:hypothetical protein
VERSIDERKPLLPYLERKCVMRRIIVPVILALVIAALAAETSLVCLALAAQNMGRTRPIPTPTPPGGHPGAAVLVGGLLWALVSVVVATESANLGMRRRTWGWVVSFLAASLVAAYAFGRIV